ncbi:hypothetical protein NP233_g5754 [Leucocoprinus birnbaumii]|uniref:Sensitive to high expression protein 9, mitochondrial n=1 Tax=Leucocoprinus birnbaumii TaxID=56174 RepID=A0AAD5VS92_9AGAR|nr:hypothetical protein NP233_g5754 [Leucocoprinus birnbaumii]
MYELSNVGMMMDFERRVISSVWTLSDQAEAYDAESCIPLLLAMLPARSLLSRRVVFCSNFIACSRQNSTRPSGTNEQTGQNQENVEKEPPVARDSAIPLSAPPPKPHETPIPESTSDDASSSSTPFASKKDPGSDIPDSLKRLPQYDLDVVKQRIREWTDQAAITLRERADGFTAQTKTRFSKLGAELNRVTGYEEIEALKREVVAQEEKIKATRQAAKQAKLAYEQAVVQRSDSQREVNELLQRKSIWNDMDVARFTTIVRQDHLYEQEEARAKAAVDETEAAVEREFTSLMRSILARYHEEQVWSDKIRSASTYGSLAALGLNLLVFILAIVIVEPWKRRRLAQTFEKKIEEMSIESKERMEESLKEIGEKFVQQENLLSQVLQEVGSVRDLQQDVMGMQKTVENVTPVHPVQVVEVPVPVQKYISIPGVPVSLPQRTFELAAVGVGAFVLGIIAAVLAD